MTIRVPKESRRHQPHQVHQVHQPHRPHQAHDETEAYRFVTYKRGRSEKTNILGKHR